MDSPWPQTSYMDLFTLKVCLNIRTALFGPNHFGPNNVCNLHRLWSLMTTSYRQMECFLFIATQGLFVCLFVCFFLWRLFAPNSSSDWFNLMSRTVECMHWCVVFHDIVNTVDQTQMTQIWLHWWQGWPDNL